MPPPGLIHSINQRQGCRGLTQIPAGTEFIREIGDSVFSVKPRRFSVPAPTAILVSRHHHARPETIYRPLDVALVNVSVGHAT
jgi:hypothetical protein